MFRKIRYAVVVGVAVAIVSGVFFLAEGRKNSEKKSSSAASESQINTAGKASSAEASFTASSSESGCSEDTSADLSSADTTSVTTNALTESLKTAAVTESTTTVPVTESSTTEAVTEPNLIQPEIPEDAIGLQAYFRHKLVIDLEQVKLYLNVREEPNEDSEILAVLYANDLVSYTEISGNWYKVIMPDCEGYVHAGYVLADEKCYEAMASSMAYGAITKQDEIFFYEKPDVASEIVVCAEQAEIFRVKDYVENEQGSFYEVYVISDYYSTLFVKTEDVVLFYRPMGRGNDSGLSAEASAYFNSLNLEGNEAEKEAIEAEKAAYDNYIAESKAAVQSSIQASIQARQDEINAQLASGQAAYLGEFTVTGYCHCTKCCHGWGNDDPNATAYGSSGLPLVSDYSCAADISVLPYGAHILINGHEYVVMDTGVYGDWIDIYRSDHDYAESIGMQTASVYLLSY